MEHYKVKKYSLFEFNNLKKEDNMNYELIDGILFMSPRPNFKHQEIMSNLNVEIGTYLKNKPCKVFTEIELEINNNVVIPDLSVICNLHSTDFQRYTKAPEIVIEILSQSSRYTDMFTKLFKYEIFGVKEYWVLNPKTEIITVYCFENKTNNEFSKNEILKSFVFDDLAINLQNIFTQ